MKRILLIAATVASLVVAQEGTPVNISVSAPLVGFTNIFYYSGSDLQYACRAKSLQPTVTFAVAGTPTPYVLTSIVVLTNVGTVTTVSDNGLKVNDRIVVSGGSDTDLNTSYAIATVTNSKVFTIATTSVSNGTYTTGVSFTTTAPRTTMPIWSIQKFTAVASQITASQWANGTSGTTQICDNRATLAYQ